MSAGMWQGLLAGYQDVEAKKMAREEKEEEVLRRRRTIASTLRPKIQSGMQAVDEQRTMLSYLRDRGLSSDRINALSEDPETLKGAYEFAREGKGADLDAEQLADIYQVARVGEGEPQDAFERLQSMADIYGSFEEAEDPETFMSLIPTQPPRNTVVETRMPQDPEKVEVGINPRIDALYRTQENLFNRNVLVIARQDLNRLKARSEAGEALTDEQRGLQVNLERDLASFESNPNSVLAIRGVYGEAAMNALIENEDLADFVEGIRNNPYIYLLTEGEGTGFRTDPLPEEAPVVPEGVTHEDDDYWYVPKETGGYYWIPKP
jgi:hypothetical protein